jgi:protoporphyrin/coproporphyrin ferrochelatase
VAPAISEAGFSNDKAVMKYDALLIVAFGGPEHPDEVMPFLENVVRGRNVPRERLLEVAEHYMHFGGVSPINSQVRELIDALRQELDGHGIALPIYWGNRNWHPLLPDTLQQMTDDGITRALGLVIAAYSSYSSCRQYRENVEDARRAVGEGAPQVDKVRVFYNHPRFVAANVDCLNGALGRLSDAQRRLAHVAYTAHSIPMSMANTSDYERQLTETCRLVSEAAGVDADRWKLVYQSRSGRPSDPWLEPDILDHLRELKRQDVPSAVVMPIGFLSDHMEVLFDLDVEARHVCDEIELDMVRAATVGTHPEFIAMWRELIEERLSDDPSKRRAVGCFGPNHDVCPADCCPAPQRPR